MIEKIFSPSSKLPGWINSADESGIIIYTSAYLRRNIQGYKFVNQLQVNEIKELSEKIVQAIISGKIFNNNHYKLKIDYLPPEYRALLAERGIIPHDSRQKNVEVLFDETEETILWLFYTEHLTIKTIKGGINFDKCLKKISNVEDKLTSENEKELEFEFSPEFGYLTSVVNFTGTGLTFEVLTHLPALSFSEKIKELYGGLPEIGFYIKGYINEGAYPPGSLYLIGNNITLGISEIEIINKFRKILAKIIKMEKAERESLIKTQPLFLFNRLNQSVNAVKVSSALPLKNALEYLSDIRLGVITNLIKNIELKEIEELLLLVQPGHLYRYYNIEWKSINEAMENRLRSTLIRDKLGLKGGVIYV